MYLRAPESVVLSRFIERKGSIDSQDLSLIHRDCTLFLDKLQESRLEGVVKDLFILDATQEPSYLARQLHGFTYSHYMG